MLVSRLLYTKSGLAVAVLVEGLFLQDIMKRIDINASRSDLNIIKFLVWEEDGLRCQNYFYFQKSTMDQSEVWLTIRRI